MLAVALSMPLAGKLGDLRGHRRVYLTGFAVFTVFSGLTAFAWDGTSLSILRILGAFGGAATAPASMAIVMRHFTGDDRVRAMGWWQLVGAGAPVIGLAAGGPVVDAFGWRWLFIGQFVFALVALAIATIVLRDSAPHVDAALDVRGAVTLGLGVVSLLLALQRGGSTGWLQPFVPIALVVGAASLVAFVRVERRVGEPLLPLAFFARRNFTASVLTQFAANFAYMGSFIVSPLLVTDRFAFTTGGAAAAMAIRPLIFSLTSPAAGYIAVRVGDRRMSVTGVLLVLAAMVAFAVAAATDTLPLVFVGLGIAGLGMGIATPSLVSAVGNAVDSAHLGAANAAQAMIASLGAATGIQVLSTAQEAGSGASAFTVAYAVAGVMALGAVVSASFVRSAATSRGLRLARAA